MTHGAERYPGEHEDESSEDSIFGDGELDLQGVESLELLAIDHLGDNDELDEEDSSENVLRGIAEETRRKWNAFGVEGLKAVDHERILQLWDRMSMDSYLMDDLMLFVLDHKIKTFNNPYIKVSFKDLEERSESAVNPYQIRIKLAENIVPNLVRFRYKKNEAYRWAQKGAPHQSQAVRLLGWLLPQPYMKDFPARVMSEEAAKGSPLNMRQMVSLATYEVERKLRIHQARESQYNPRISYEQQLYDEVGKTLQNTQSMCKSIFLGERF